MSAIPSSADTVAVVIAQDTQPKPGVRKDNCMGHHWKMCGITITPGIVGLVFGVSSIAAGALSCRSSSNYVGAIACAVVALALSIFSCVQSCLPYVDLNDEDENDPKAYCNGVICKLSGTFAAKALIAGLIGAILTGVTHNGC